MFGFDRKVPDNYQIVRGKLEEVEIQVQALILKGWEPQGGVSGHDIYVAQAMFKPKEAGDV